MGRKEFFKTAGRLLLLGGIISGTGYLVANKKVSTHCEITSLCRDCGKFAQCNLQKAIDARHGNSL